MTRIVNARSRTGRRRRGFTLIEVAMAIVIIGVSVTAMMQLFAACSKQNNAGAQMTTALLLATNVQEAMAGLTFNDPFQAATTFGPESGETLATYNDVDDFDGRSFNPPIDSFRQGIPDLSQYQQVVTVVPVQPNQPGGNMNGSISKTTYTGAVRVTVVVNYRQSSGQAWKEAYRLSWIRVDR